jgi:hypothetical protein
VLIAGCGSSTSSSSTSAGTSAPATTASTATTSATSPIPNASSIPKGISPEAEIAACKKGLEAQTTFPAGLKARLEADCVKAAHGDKAAIKQGARELCEEVVRTSRLAVGAAKEKALALCKAK